MTGRFKKLTLLSLAALVVCVSSLRAEEPKAAPAAENTAIVPVPRKEANNIKRHESFNEKAAKGDVDLVFIGDSITQGWEGAGKDAWAKFYGNRKAMNLGIGGDRTQHVLWRLDHGNMDSIKPKLAVIMIGTNNSNGMDNTGEQIGEGIKAVVKKVQEKSPETKILLLAVFPRGEKPSPQREKNAKASEIASKLADDKKVFYMDIGPKFLESDQTLTTTNMVKDLLHLNSQGYQTWAEAIEPKVKELLGEK